MNEKTHPIERRHFLAAAIPALPLGLSVACAQKATSEVTPSPKRVLRLAHFCDVHVQPEKRAAQGFAAALAHAQEHHRPDVILNGGDQVMDVMSEGRARSTALFALWNSVMEKECSLPTINVIGNHDVWGWNTEKSGATGSESDYGKKWAADVFGMARPYQVIDRSGWRIIVLDSTHPVEGGLYTARLDDGQFQWLSETLESTPKDTPVMVASHMPIVSACTMFDGENEKSGDWVIPGSWMHIDARRIKNLFHKHPNVRLCVSGHIHLADSVEYLGVTYACNHAVCGSWWDGNRAEFPPAYAIIDLFDDGSATNRLIDYGWKPATS